MIAEQLRKIIKGGEGLTEATLSFMINKIRGFVAKRNSLF